MQNEKSNGSKIPAFLAGAALVTLVGVAGLAWRPAREKLAKMLLPPAAPSLAASEAGTTPQGKVLYYEDPMHPWYRSDKPGIAPDCGMKLVPVYAEEKPSVPVGSFPPGTVQISPARQQLIGVTTATAEYRTLDRQIRTVGRVETDETRTTNVHVRISGWIQKVFVDYTFQHVMKGDPLFTIYSPELLATEQEYLLALKAQKSLGGSPYHEVATGSEMLLEAARRRLALWDLTDGQIRELERSGKPQREITIYSPATGHVQERKAFPNQYVTPDTNLYTLVDHSTVWVYADVYESELPLVRVGQEAAITTESLPGQTIRGRVDYIQPHLMTETRTLPVRMEFPNPDLKLKPGMFVNVELHASLGRQLTVPSDAVLDSGVRQVVFVDRGNGYFEPRTVKLGEYSGSFATIQNGLRAGEKVVTRANFLIDSESNLREAMAGMTGMPGMEPGATTGAEAPRQPPRHQH
ncbi:MAG TPA: efflux RND transporter periplasmic adaptor subunit [Terriglobia bacterium]|jgi:RND family efflux transporter MFP subunit|nr:efflux RND transporter periplasmic adaptor subunit [Terriglobia bacterium]